jgi:hypothetical protein
MTLTAKVVPAGAVANTYIWNRTLYNTERRVIMTIVTFFYQSFGEILLNITLHSYRAWKALGDAIAKQCVHSMNVKSFLATAFSNPIVVFILLRSR